MSDRVREALEMKAWEIVHAFRNEDAVVPYGLTPREEGRLVRRIAAALAAATPGEPESAIYVCIHCKWQSRPIRDGESVAHTCEPPTPETVERVARVIYVYAEAGWPDEWETLPERTRMRLLGAASAALRAMGEGA